LLVIGGRRRLSPSPAMILMSTIPSVQDFGSADIWPSTSRVAVAAAAAPRTPQLKPSGGAAAPLASARSARCWRSPRRVPVEPRAGVVVTVTWIGMRTIRRCRQPHFDPYRRRESSAVEVELWSSLVAVVTYVAHWLLGRNGCRYQGGEGEIGSSFPAACRHEREGPGGAVATADA